MSAHAAIHLAPLTTIVATQYQGITNTLHEATHNPAMSAAMALIVGGYAVRDWLQERAQPKQTTKEKLLSTGAYSMIGLHALIHTIPLTPKKCVPSFSPTINEQCHYAMPLAQTMNDFMHTTTGALTAAGTLAGFFTYEAIRDKKRKQKLEDITSTSYQNV